jgi:phosphatidylglycerophosphatase A
LHGGFGIVIDDFIACLYALAINHAIYCGAVAMGWMR